jgi:hypothetical protein
MFVALHSKSLALTQARQERNIHYVVQIEIFLAKAFEILALDDDDDVLSVDILC